MTSERTFIKIRRGAERFWVEIIGQTPDGYLARVDSPTVTDEAPRQGEEIELDDDEYCFDMRTETFH